MASLREYFVNNKTFATNFSILILIILVYLSLFFLPKTKAIFQLLPQVRQLKLKVSTTQQEWKNIDSFKQRISRLGEKIDFYEKKLPGEKDIPAILEYLSDAAGKLNVRITDIKPLERDEDKQAAYYSVPIVLKAECGYHQLGRFLSELERADRFMKISDIKVAVWPGAKPDQGRTLSAELLIVTYVMGK